MMFSSILAGLASVATAHTLFSELYVNGEPQGDATCIRMPTEGSTSTSPVNGLTSNDMACGRVPKLQKSQRRGVHIESMF